MNPNRNKTKHQAKAQIKAEAPPSPNKELLRKPRKADNPRNLNDVIAQGPTNEQMFLATDEESKRNADQALRRRINLEIQSCAEKQNRQLTDAQAKRRSVEDKARNGNGETARVTQKALRRTQQPARESAASEVTQPSSAEAKMLVNTEDSAVSDSVHTPSEVANKAIDVVLSEKGMVPLAEVPNIPVELLNRLNSDSSVDRAGALIDLARLGGNSAFRFITKAFDDHSADVRNAAARALYNLQQDRAVSFTRALREGTAQRRRNIGASLASSGLASDALSNLLRDSREKTYEAFSVLFLMAKAGEVQPIMKAIEDHPSVEVRLAVIKMLALTAQPEIVPLFRRLTVRATLPSQVRTAVMEAIYQISSQNRETTPSAA